MVPVQEFLSHLVRTKEVEIVSDNAKRLPWSRSKTRARHRDVGQSKSKILCRWSSTAEIKKDSNLPSLKRKNSCNTVNEVPVRMRERRDENDAQFTVGIPSKQFSDEEVGQQIIDRIQKLALHAALSLSRRPASLEMELDKL